MPMLLAAIMLLGAAPPQVAVFHAEGLTDTPAILEGAQRVAPEGIDALPPETLLLLHHPAVFPAAALRPVEEFVKRGGHLLAVGEPPFTKLVYRRHDGTWADLETCLGETPAAHPLVDWGAVNGQPAQRGSGHPPASATYTALEDGYSGVLVIPEAASWETRELPCSKAADPADDVLLFRASGAGRATQLLVELREHDGARWMAKVALTPEERGIGIHRSAFRYWPDAAPTNRGGEGDMPDFTRCQAVIFGFAASHMALHAGRYEYTIRGVATGKCTADVSTPNLPRLEGFSPSYKLFQAEPARIEWSTSTTGMSNSNHSTVWSAIARPVHASPDRDYFWQPHAKGFDENGVWCCTPFSTTWHTSGATWSFLGADLAPQDLEATVAALREHIAQGPPVARPPALETTWEQGPCIEVRDGRFMLDDKPWFAHGINFWPLYVSGMEPPEYFSHWLTSANYIPELVEADLATLESLGVNLVSIQYARVKEAPQLRDFITRCGRHGIKVNVFLSGAHPIHPSAMDNLAERPFMELLRAADLRGNPHVFAYDLAWEPRMGVYAERRQYDALWLEWIVEQYGSLERAEAVWRFPVPRVDGVITGPTDEHLMHDGEHRIMVAAYRRFADDLISRRYGEVVRLAKTIDNTHLFGARTGYGGTGTKGVVRVMPFQLTSGAAHLDFLSPEGYGYGPENISDAALVSAYARWAGNGKPVFWSEFGRSVLNGGDIALAQQAKLYLAFAEMLKVSDADGWACWWYPGGLRVDEQSDFGIIAPDRAIRPSARVLGETAGSLAALPDYAPPLESLEIEPDATPDGLAGAVERHSAEFSKAFDSKKIPHLRTAGTSTDSTNCPFTAVGGIAYEAPGPIQHLNAEIAVISFRDNILRIRALNTGEASWSVEDCGMTVVSNGSVQVFPLSGPVSRFEAVEIEIPAAPGQVVVMKSTRFGEFGQRLRVGAGGGARG
ncbi:MAG: hypothetical protein IT365_16715 [Candidatus Hydrogenedentes bacterium]|nr:hypothetical protein [Candidatus Hydrogenedentota bacterium]